MPATEETYRSQRALHIVFAVTSIAMTLAIVWMILDDHLRPWKKIQREFHKVETAKLEVQKSEERRKLDEKHKRDLEALDAEIARAQEIASKNARIIAEKKRELDKVRSRFDRLDTDQRFLKADLDSKKSFYDGFIERDEVRQAEKFRIDTIEPLEKMLENVRKERETVFEERKRRMDEIAALEGNIDQLKKKREDLTRDVNRVERVLKQKEAQYGEGGPVSAFLAFLRDLPGLDMAAPPVKINQISLPELTINYNFKQVPRYDRCQTCHLGIDKIGYDVDAQGKPMKSTHPAFAAHPELTHGYRGIDPETGKAITAGLYLDGNGPHPINSFGCTICHGGQGSGTDFNYTWHEPDNLKQAEHWNEKYGWKETHFWDYPMLPKKFIEASCIKCHREVTDIPRAKKLQAGYRRIVKYGCTGCHTIGGPGSFGPDLTDNRQVGPNLKHLAYKASKDWVLRWIKNPHAFRPDTRMPKFYGLHNNSARNDWPKSHAEIQAITHYLFKTSTKPERFEMRSEKGDPARGKTLFAQKGCLACHAHRPYETAEVKGEPNEKYKIDPKSTYDPSNFPESVREYARADQGPNLSNVAAKFRSKEQGSQWVTNWVHAPENYHPESLMPNLQLSWQDAADIASWLLSIPGEWPGKSEVPDLDGKTPESIDALKGLDELVALYVSKTAVYKDPLSDKPARMVLLTELDDFVKKLPVEDKLTYIGEKTISRLGCFGCHQIEGFDKAKPIGTALNGWGLKPTSRLEFAHIAEYLEDKPAAEDGSRDGTPPEYQEKLVGESRMGFLFQKLHRPRSYDYRKTNEDIKAWDDRLRMPQFAWADDPKAIEEVMTFVLGLTDEVVSAEYLPKTKYNPAQIAKAKGERLIERYNCKGCHVFEMPTYTIAAGRKVADALPDLKLNFDASSGGLGRGLDYPQLYPDLKFDPKHPPKLDPDDGSKSYTLVGMPLALEEVLDDAGKKVIQRRQSIQLWEPATILGYTFNIGDALVVDLLKVDTTKPKGGDFAWAYTGLVTANGGDTPDTYWNRLPPPLLREGFKVQTPWLSRFLKDPYAIRPATYLRMPRFHYGDSNSTREETATIANYFAAVDGADFPYQDVPERERSYLAERDSRHPGYLSAGWDMMAKGACMSCHALGKLRPTGDPSKQLNGPDLRQVADRFRPEFLLTWLARPSRLVPYTAMPQNVPPNGDVAVPTPKTFEKEPFQQVRAIRDTLLNYSTAVETQLAGPPAEKSDRNEKKPADSASKAGG